MLLDIVLTHYNESFDVGKLFFDMLAVQKGVDFSKIRVILVHDGSDFFPEENFSDYPYKVEQHRIAHKGVSAARNFGMDLATAKWLCFCDFDDYYTDVYALKLITESLKTSDFDLLWNPIYMEDYIDDEFVVYPLLKFNMIFVHNKYIRTDFLYETKLRFNESLSYSEDTAFLAILNIMLEENRIGKIKSPCPLYTWSYREGSCTTDDDNKPRNIEHLFNANIYISREMERLHYKDADLMKFRAICDVYMAATSRDAPKCDELLQRVARYWIENKSRIAKQSKKELQRVYNCSVGNNKFLRKSFDRPSLGMWLKDIEDKYLKE